MTQSLAIPIHPENVEADWMTAALQQAGMLRNSTVTSLHSELVSSQGIIGKVARFHLEYDTVEANQAPSIIIKFPTPDPELRKNLHAMYQREINFYSSLSACSGIPVPKYLFSAADESLLASILLIEDVAAYARPSCWVCGCTLQDARAALEYLAKFHAQWWESGALEQLPWLSHKRDYLKDVPKDQFSQEFEELVQRLRDEMPEYPLPPAFIQTGALLAKNLIRIKNFLYSAPATLIHDDYHLDNMLFGGSEENPEPVIIDWQCIARGPGVCDVAYFIGLCLSPEQRQQAEHDLLKAYYATLCAHGVKDYDYSRFLLDYRLAALEPLERLVQVRHWVNRADPRALEIFEAVLYRLDSFLEHSRIEELVS